VSQGGATWYVRPDGGTRYSTDLPTGQCDGMGDAAYSGTGVNQHCAFNDYRYLYATGAYGNKAWVIAGGDTVILRGGPWRVGYNGPNDADYFGSDPGDPYDASNPTIPPGTASQHTRILGENYASCTTKTQLFGGYAVGTVINLAGTQNVDVQCLEISDQSQCSREGTTAADNVQCSSSYPLDDYASVGIGTDNTTANVLLQDLNIHGLVSRAMLGPIGGTVTVKNVRMAYNGGAGWDFDDGNGTPSVNGNVLATGLTVEWNGCNEEYPIVDANPALKCFDQDSAGYGDGLGTPNTPLNFTCDNCLFRYNTQDGFDLLHVSGSQIKVTNSESYGNMGQQWKLGPMQSVVFQDNLTIHNCNRMSAAIPGAPSGYNEYLSLFCRAAGDGFAMGMIDGGTYTFQNNSFVGYGDTTYDIECNGTGTCDTASIIFQNNLHIGYTNPFDGETPGIFYFGNGASTSNFTQRDHNIFFNFRTGCPTGYANETCGDPLITSEPAFTSEASLDSVNFLLQSSSPAVKAGVQIPGLTLDYGGNVFSNPPSIGAYELAK